MFLSAIRTEGRPKMSSSPNPTDQLEVAADQAIAACDGDTREAVKALIIANHLLEEKLRASVSPGYARLPRDRKDWYD
jgi:hypothetical protein